MKHESPYCEHCKESDCGVSLDGDCNQIRVYLSHRRMLDRKQEEIEEIVKMLLRTKNLLKIAFSHPEDHETYRGLSKLIKEYTEGK